MKTLISDYFHELLTSVEENRGGEIPTYIPALAEIDPDLLGIALCTTTGNHYESGASRDLFTIQSVSKPFVYALAMEDLGIDEVSKVVGVEPSGEAFNELSLEEEHKRPMNPMINAGAIAVNQLINGTDSSVEDRVEYLRQFFSRLAGRELEIKQDSVDGELEGADRNLSIAHMLRSYEIIVDDAHDAVLSYTQQCSLGVNLHDLAVMGATLANGGTQPVTGEEILSPEVCRHTMAVMASCGMYDAAGRWMASVGIPAKSGVSGALIGVLPGAVGIATLSPRLDSSGNSVRGVEIFQKLSRDMGLHLMSSEQRSGNHTVRTIRREGEDTIVSIQGLVDFSGAESILEILSSHDFGGERIVFDVSKMVDSNPMGRRMLKEGLRRLRDRGYAIGVVDPESDLHNRELKDGSMIPLVDEEEIS